LPSGKWQLRWYEGEGEDRKRHAGGVFGSKSEALRHFHDVIEPTLDGRTPVRRELTLQELADVYLERHSKNGQPRTIRSLRERLKRPLDAYGDVSLVELEHMTDEIAGFAAKLPDGYRYSVMSALRQTLAAGVRYGYLMRNPAVLAGPNPMPPPRAIRVFTPEELDAVTDELDTRGAAAVRFAAATGLRPGEWSRLERRDVDRARRAIDVRGTKTRASRREVPLTSAALAALDSLPPRLDSPYVFAGPKRGPFDFHNFRRREWGPAIVSAGITKPARIYDLRSTFISNALASGLTIFEVARISGTSTAMVESRYGALLDSARESLLERLDSAYA
jgi:integrase